MNVWRVTISENFDLILHIHSHGAALGWMDEGVCVCVCVVKINYKPVFC